jgi:hypothetical protein
VDWSIQNFNDVVIRLVKLVAQEEMSEQSAQAICRSVISQGKKEGWMGDGQWEETRDEFRNIEFVQLAFAQVLDAATQADGADADA